ncbi:MAG: hypothetical protein U0794_19215 [Isosphaeraceae bacterium]
MATALNDESQAGTPLDMMADLAQPRTSSAGRFIIAGSMMAAVLIASTYLVFATRLYQATAKLRHRARRISLDSPPPRPAGWSRVFKMPCRPIWPWHAARSSSVAPSRPSK